MRVERIRNSTRAKAFSRGRKSFSKGDYVVLSDVPDGGLDYAGPFKSEEKAQEYIQKAKERGGRDV